MCVGDGAEFNLSNRASIISAIADRGGSSVSVGFYMVDIEEYRLACSTFSPGAVHIWMILRLRANEEGHAWPKQARIMNDSGLPDRTVRDALHQLEKGGWIERDGYVSRAVKWLLHPPTEEARSRQVPAGFAKRTRQKATDYDSRTRQASAGLDPCTRQTPAALVDGTRQALAGYDGRTRQDFVTYPADLCNSPIQKNSIEINQSTPTPNSNCEQGAEARCSPPSAGGVDSPSGEEENQSEEFLVAEKIRLICERLNSQPWWLRKLLAKPFIRAKATSNLVREYASRWNPETVMTWIDLAVDTGGVLRVSNPGAWVYAHLRGYGAGGWNPEKKAGGVRQMHQAILRGDPDSAHRAMRLENGYGAEHRAKHLKDEMTAGYESLARDLAGDPAFAEIFSGETAPEPVRSPQSGHSHTRTLLIQEATAILTDIDGWLEFRVNGRDPEDARERVAMTQALVGRLVERCDPLLPARCLLDLFMMESEGMEKNGLDTAWAWSTLENVANGGPTAVNNGMPSEFYTRIYHGDFEGAASHFAGEKTNA